MFRRQFEVRYEVANLEVVSFTVSPSTKAVCIENLHLPEQPVKAAVPRETIEETICVT
jgi:hypothetical protein